MKLDHLKQFELSKEKQKKVTGNQKYCATVHDYDSRDSRTFCNDSAELVGAWVYAWEGLGWSTKRQVFFT